MKGKEAFALLMAMRTGKTKVALDDFGTMEAEGKASDLLVIAPAGVYKTWIEAIKEHVSLDLQERLLIHVWQAGQAKRAKAFLASLDCPRIFLMNVEALSRPGDARKLAIKFVTERKAGIIIDESTVIKNPSAKRTKFINNELAPLSSFRRILSGLVTPRSPLDLFAQFEFLDWNILGFRSYYAWARRYTIPHVEWFGGRRVQLFDRFVPGAAEELAALIEPYSFRVPFRPNIPSTYTIRHVRMSEEQERHYQEIKEYATTQLSNGMFVTPTIVISQILRLHQILCGHVPDDEKKGIHEIKEHRTEELIDLLEDYQGKAVIWCSYDIDVRKVSLALEKHFEIKVARFWGGNTNTREAEEKAFRTQDDTPYMVATPDAGGRGRKWDVADLVVYYSSRNNLEHRDQSEQRVQGVDKKRQVDYVDLIVPDTVEIKILEALRNKIDMAAVINGDTWREWLI